MEAVNRTVALANFYGDGKHLYEDELGWWPSVKEEAHSMISRDIFEYEIVHIGLNLAFYYIDNDTCYGLHTESLPIEFKILPVVRKSRRPSLAAKWLRKVVGRSTGRIPSSSEVENHLPRKCAPHVAERLILMAGSGILPLPRYMSNKEYAQRYMTLSSY